MRTYKYFGKFTRTFRPDGPIEPAPAGAGGSLDVDGERQTALAAASRRFILYLLMASPKPVCPIFARSNASSL